MYRSLWLTLASPCCCHQPLPCQAGSHRMLCVIMLPLYHCLPVHQRSWAYQYHLIIRHQHNLQLFLQLGNLDCSVNNSTSMVQHLNGTLNPSQRSLYAFTKGTVPFPITMDPLNYGKISVVPFAIAIYYCHVPLFIVMCPLNYVKISIVPFAILILPFACKILVRILIPAQQRCSGHHYRCYKTSNLESRSFL